MPIQSLSSRRRFLKSSVGGALAIGVDAKLPQFVLQAAEQADRHNENILVVVQLSGGNDGLNTVIPYADDAYRAARPELAIASSEVLTIDDHLGLHPALRGLSDLLEQGQLAIVQGVGYDQPNRSHFESMDIWHTCQRKEEQRVDGWLGRFLDRHAAGVGGDVPALHLGRNQQPFALAARNVRTPSITSLDEFQLRSNDQQSFRDLIADLSQTRAAISNPLLDFVQSSTASAIVASERVAQASHKFDSAVEYPDTELARKLSVVAQLIQSGLSTRIYYVELDGFDTHAEQADTHAILLREWSGALAAFLQDLTLQGQEKRTCVMSFSEFGRRVAENASGGTDHGAAAPMFLCGGGVKAGLFGAAPDLSDLQDGDLKHSIDFRQVYAAVLQGWLGGDASEVLKGRFEPMPLFSRG